MTVNRQKYLKEEKSLWLIIILRSSAEFHRFSNVTFVAETFNLKNIWRSITDVIVTSGVVRVAFVAKVTHADANLRIVRPISLITPQPTNIPYTDWN